MVWKTHKDDYTLMRGLPMDFSSDKKTLSINDEYMFGPAILVKPVTRHIDFPKYSMGEDIPSELMQTAKGEKGGFTGEYYSGINFEKLMATQVDKNINFSWNGSGAPNLGNTNFSVRWTGKIKAPETESYEIATTSDDGVRLWLDGKLVIDNWTVHSDKIDQCKMNLEMGKEYDVKLEYYQGGAGSTIKLGWKPPSFYNRGVAKKDNGITDTYLPAGTFWFDFWTGGKLIGGQTTQKENPAGYIPFIH